MKQTVDFYMFERAFKDYNRAENFTYSGLRALFDYIEDLESDVGEEMELDVIALCCDFAEYCDPIEAYAEITGDNSDVSGSEALEYLRDHTTVIEYDSGLIVQSF